MRVSQNHQHGRRGDLRVAPVPMVAGFALTFVVSCTARDLVLRFMGGPFGLWMGAQGPGAACLLSTGLHARCMNRLDIEHGVAGKA